MSVNTAVRGVPRNLRCLRAHQAEAELVGKPQEVLTLAGQMEKARRLRHAQRRPTDQLSIRRGCRHEGDHTPAAPLT
jgi:hypothetical protein